MCITFGNPSEPCCAGSKVCKACPAVDWSQWTWLWEQPAGQNIVMPDSVFSTSNAWQNLFPDAPYFVGRYEAVRRRMNYYSGCLWFAMPVRAVYGVDDTSDALAGNPDGSNPNLPSGFLRYYQPSNTSSPQWQAGFTTGNFTIYDEPGLPLEAEYEATVYTLRDRWNCRGENYFDLDRDAASQPDLYPEWIKITRVSGTGVRRYNTYMNQPPDLDPEHDDF